MLFSEKSESDIFKANLKEIKSSYRTDEEEDDVESLIPCAEANPQKESSDDKNSTASNTVKEFKNFEGRTRVPSTPEKDSFIHKGIKNTDLDTGRQF